VLSNTKSRFAEAVAALDQVVQLTVTGVDVKGQMFRHSATVLMLDGRDCAFLSKSQPELESSILAEFNYPQAETKRRVSQGRVQSSQVEEESGLYKVVVELEVAQTVKVVPNSIEPQTAINKPDLSPFADSRADDIGDPIRAPLEFPLPLESKGIPQTLPRSNNQNGGATRMVESRELLPKSQAEDASAVYAAVKTAVATEIKQQINLLKSWLSSELEKAVPAIVASNLEKMIGEAVEKQISVNSQTSIQALNLDVARQVGDRIAESEDLRTALESMAKKLFEEQSVLSRAAGAKVEQELNSRAATIIRSFEDSIAEMGAKINAAPSKAEQELNLRTATIIQSFEASIAEVEARITAVPASAEQELNSRAATIKRSFEDSIAEIEARVNAAPARVEEELNSRTATIIQSFENSIADMDARINAARSDMEAALTMAQTLKQEAIHDMLPIQKALEQLNDLERDGIEKFQRQAAAQLNTGAVQFENQLDNISAERAVRFAMEMEKHLAPHRQRADETVEKLGAILQLVQGTARVQQERITEHSKTTAANFEKEIRALLLRLAGGA
jgi:hypothetical protein